jgi:succinyl-CoA synthetase beta subunit
MKLFEFEAKKIFAKHGIQIPKGIVIHTPDEAGVAVHEVGGEVAIKAQVLVAGRGKTGGIKFTDNMEEARTIAETLIGSNIKGLKVSRLLVEEKLRVSAELFISVTVDRSARCYVIVSSTEGGVDIEAVAEKSPEKIIRYSLGVLKGFHSYEAIEIARKMGYHGRKMITLATVIQNLYRVTLDYDAELAEINPLVETEDGEFVAADARIIIDDNALYRHSELREKALKRLSELTPREAEARRHGLAYVDLEGNIGVIGNGAGLVMATLDLVQLYGGKPANFLDLGGGASVDSVKLALRTVLSKPEVDVVLITVLGGITRCDEVARGIISSLNELKEKRPMVVRIVGTREEEGKELLTTAGIKVTDDLDEAVEKAVELVKR